MLLRAVILELVTNRRTFVAVSFERVKFTIVDVLFVCFGRSIAGGKWCTWSGRDETSGPVFEDEQGGITERSQSQECSVGSRSGRVIILADA